MHNAHLMDVDLNLLVVLDALLAEASVTRAAARLGRTQPAVSRSLGRLRDLLGDPLLVRDGTTMVPTPRALALRGPVQRVLRSVTAEVLSEQRFDPGTATRTFTLASADYTEATLLVRALVRLAAEGPGIDLVLQPGDHTAIDEVELTLFPGRPVQGSARSVFVGDEGFSCLVRADHGSVGEVLDLETYAALPHVLVAPRGKPGGVVDQALERLGRSRRVWARTRSFLVAPELIARSDAILTIPTRLGRLAASRLPLRLLEPPLPLPTFAMHVSWHARWHHDPGHRWLRGVVIEELRRAFALDAAVSGGRVVARAEASGGR